ncbi:helix-turn-helix transcriptional regulator [Mucilaginibacter corticis]|uniref:Helix-turn-helix transcriptional regulator n=1 Tax=Mucilaginibacter corticis TaxID=2597670 RepID=A0A556M9N6_9SPHI|nr:helix-turn-helix transcriptional regulator [Mucilaginibacter corticis]TSJ36566.1 helix-turn-helix transcriptional regulator [Mucilaginibacter corticis]
MARRHISEPKAIELLAMNVRKYRTKANISQTVLADLIGVSYSQIARIELGEINTSVSMIYLIAIALEIEPAQLLEN